MKHTLLFALLSLNLISGIVHAEPYGDCMREFENVKGCQSLARATSALSQAYSPKAGVGAAYLVGNAESEVALDRTKKIRASQSAWLQYRDTQCTAYGAWISSKYSVQREEKLNCLVEKTNSRTQELGEF